MENGWAWIAKVENRPLAALRRPLLLERDRRRREGGGGWRAHQIHARIYARFCTGLQLQIDGPRKKLRPGPGRIRPTTGVLPKASGRRVCRYHGCGKGGDRSHGGREHPAFQRERRAPPALSGGRRHPPGQAWTGPRVVLGRTQPRTNTVGRGSRNCPGHEADCVHTRTEKGAPAL